MATNIVELILFAILKIPTDVVYEYVSVADQLIYLILIPTLITLMFVWVFGGWFSPQHPKFAILVSIVTYIFLIYSGWYGSMIVPFVSKWFAISIAAAFIFFVVSKIIHPMRGAGIYKLAGAAGKRVKEVTVGKSKERNEIEDEIKQIDKDILDLTTRKKDTTITAETRSYYDMKIYELNSLKRKLKKKL